MKKKVIAVFLLAVFVFTLCACSGAKAAIVGTWKREYVLKNTDYGDYGDLMVEYLKLYSNGKGESTLSNITKNTTPRNPENVFWKYDSKEGVVLIHHQGRSNQEISYIYQNDMLVSPYSSQSDYTYRRVLP